MASCNKPNTSDVCLPSQAVLSKGEETAVLQRIERGVMAIDMLVGLLTPHLEGAIRKCTPGPAPVETVLTVAQTGLREVLFGLGTDGAAVVTTPKELLHRLRRKVAEAHPSPCETGDGEAWVEELLPCDPLERQIGAVLDAEATLRFAVENRMKAAHTLVEANMRWVFKVARSFAGRGIDQEDLRQEGALRAPAVR